MKKVPALYSIVIVLLLAAIAGCSSTPTETEKPKAGGWVGYTEKGKASFYADKHQNQKTANGDRYDHNLKTAAHRTIPFGSQLKVTNVDNGKSVVATVNDRGPYARGRIVDLSKSAFDSIASTSSGVIDVQIEVIK